MAIRPVKSGPPGSIRTDLWVGNTAFLTPEKRELSCFAQESHLGLAYKSTQIGMGFVEMSGSMVWYHSVRLELGPWSMIPAAMNVSAWLLVKFQPLFHAALGIKTTISHQLAHYMQVVVIWFLHTINLRKEFGRREIREGCL